MAFDFKIHGDGDLLSFKVRGEGYSSRVLVADLLECVIIDARRLYVFSVRANYSIDSVADSLDRFGRKIVDLHMDGDNELSFCLENRGSCRDIVLCLADIWFAYEQVSFYASMSDGENINEMLRVVRGGAFWKSFATEYKSYVVYKGVEDDVVWIGKSGNLRFPREIEGGTRQK